MIKRSIALNKENSIKKPQQHLVAVVVYQLGQLYFPLYPLTKN